ncbi:DedA family protein [Streptomyces sp. CA-278952]|uniref:DedA family protein n=1 Tax=unclassified Streptomyces TaxID=2593676 RepID=UPI0022423CBB|nr:MULTISPECIES: DedA family protein [unclassified Streptomyces]UZI26842.1 DedA family protein [Streptomyces sp. VB1]WDG27024.1 DedA family protein [Streptomyces sp. CA-278952]
MSWLQDFLDSVSSVPLPATLAFAAAFSAAESGLAVGAVVPGETVVIVLAAAMPGPVALAALFVIVAVAGSAGDHVGYLLGRRYGERVRDLGVVRRWGQGRWDEAMRFLHRYGAWAVFLTRLVPLVRTLTPAAAGVAGVRYRSFLPASLAGAMTWAALYVGLGALAKASVDRIEALSGRVGWAVLATLVLLVGLRLLVRGRAARKPEQ